MHKIAIDATRLSSATLFLSRAPGQIDSRVPAVLELEAGPLTLRSNAPTPEEWIVNITDVGLIEYRADLDRRNGGFLEGAGSPELQVFGYPIAIDATALTTHQFHLANITPWLQSGIVHDKLRLLPGKYQFVQSNTFAVPEAEFTIGLDGKLDFARSSDAFLSGRGTSKFVLSGFPISIDATALTSYQFHLANITPWLQSNIAHDDLCLLPGKYQFVQSNTLAVPEAELTVGLDGKLDYARSSDSFLRGRGTSKYVLSGFPITIDATALKSHQFHLSNISSWLPSGQRQTLQLLPASYQLITSEPRAPPIDLTVTPIGEISYVRSLDNILDGMGTNLLHVHEPGLGMDPTAQDSQEPLVKLDATGRPAILSYNVPDPTSYPGRFNLGLVFGFVSDQQEIFRPRVLTAPAPLAPTGLAAARLPRRPIDDTDGGPIDGPDIPVPSPQVSLELPSTVSAMGSSGAIPLRARHSLDDPEPQSLSFVIKTPGGGQETVGGARVAGSDLWEGSLSASVPGVYEVHAKGDHFVVRGAKGKWATSTRKVSFSLTPKPAEPIDMTPPQLSFERIGAGVTTLNEQASATLEFNVHASSVNGDVTLSFLLDGQAIAAPTLGPQPDGSTRLSVTIGSAGTHSVEAIARRASGLSISRTIECTTVAAQQRVQRQHLVLVYAFELSNFLGAYGAGRTIQTFSLLPGEKAKLSIKTYQSDTDTATEAKSIMDGYDETSASDFQDAVTDEVGTKAEDKSQFAASVEAKASGSWGFASASVSGTVSGGSSSAIEQFSKNVSNAVQKHTASKSARRQAQVNYSSSHTGVSGSENVIERSIENINVSRTLNFVFRQLNQEFISLLHLTDVRVAHVSEIANPAEGAPQWSTREVSLAEMNGLLLDVVKAEHVDDVRDSILLQLDAICDYRGQITPVVEFVANQHARRDENNALVFETGADGERRVAIETDGSVYPRFRGGTQTYTDTTGNRFEVPGVILRASKNTLRSDGVIVEALLGQANALDAYSTSLQAITVRERELANLHAESLLEREKMARDLIQGAPETQRVDAYTRVFVAPAAHKDGAKPA